MYPAAHIGASAAILVDRLQGDGPRAPGGAPAAEFRRADADAVPHGRQLTRSTFVDPETQSLVFRVMSERSGAVVAQYPSEVQLHVRAYVANLDAESEPSETKAV